MKYDPHAVYLMKNRWSFSNYKVGFSRRPSIRCVEVDHDFHVDPQLLAVCWLPTEFDARAAELIWHKHLAECRTEDHGGREWFALTRSQVEEFTEWCKISPDFKSLLDDLFKGRLSRSGIKQFTNQIFQQIPKPMTHPSIDVWNAPDYYENT